MGAPPSRPAGATRPSAVAIGNFDGVHHGHRILIETAKAEAAARGLVSVVLTFDRHPATIVRPEAVPKLLTTPAERLALLEATGVDEVVVVRFDQARASESAEDFVDEVLVGELDARVVVVGATFHFGHRQRGNVELLTELGATRNFDVVPVDLIADDSASDPAVVSSSRIRHLVATGRLAEAAHLLERSHSVALVLGGDGRYHSDSSVLLPPPGTYRVTVLHANGDESPGALAQVVGDDVVTLEQVSGTPTPIRVRFDA